MGTAVNDNVELAFDVEGTGPDLLLISGTASSRAIWSLVRPELAKSSRTIAFDNRDSGTSSIVKHPYELADLAADAAAVLDAAGSKSAHIVGHSLGTGATTLSEIDLWEKTDAAMALGTLAPREAIVRQWNVDATIDTLDRLSQLDLPSHVIWCSEDRLIPPSLSQALAGAIPDAMETRIEACGHLPMIDRPDEFLHAMRRMV